MLMEYAQQGNLYEWIQNQKSQDEQICIDYIKDVIKALSYLHSQNPPIIHRDIKPENILINGATLKIADFGWSNYQKCIRNTFCGTPDYLSPEMILGSGHDESVDIWGVGVLFYEMLHRKTPFRHDINPNDRQAVKKLEHNILKGHYIFDEWISPQSRELIGMLLSPQRSKRPTARQIL